MRFSSEIFNILKERYLSLPSNNIIQAYFEAIKPIRDKQAELEKNEYVAKGKPLPQLSDQHPLDVTEKYRIDYLQEGRNNCCG